MSELKTQVNDTSVVEFINKVDNKTRRDDAFTLLTIFEDLTGCKAKMWGTSIIGYGAYEYQNRTCEGEWPVIGFSPRKSALSLYIMPGFANYDALLAKLGKYKLGKSCLYINKLKDIKVDILKELCQASILAMQEKYTCSFTS